MTQASADKPLAGRIILVTGASRGIGYFAAREIAAQGAHVIAVARTVGGLEELDDQIQAAGGSATLVPADLREGDPIDRLGAAIYERWGRLDGLVGNAAVLGPVTPVAHLDPKEFDRAFALNVTANYRLIRSLDMLLQQSDAGRALFLTAGLVGQSKPFVGLYGATKAAMEALVRSYAAEMANSKVRVNLFDPGPLRTALRAKAYPGEDPETRAAPDVVASTIARLISPAQTATGTLTRFETGEVRNLLG